MEKNQYLKCLFIVIFVFIMLFAILGCVLIYGPSKSSSDIHPLSTFWSPVWIWLMTIIFLTFHGISCLAVYAASSEKKSIFKAFAYFMGGGMMTIGSFGLIMFLQGNKSSMIRTTDSILKAAMGLYFGFAVIALLGLLLSLLMIYQVRRHNISGGASIAMRLY